MSVSATGDVVSCIANSDLSAFQLRAVVLRTFRQRNHEIGGHTKIARRCSASSTRSCAQGCVCRAQSVDAAIK